MAERPYSVLFLCTGNSARSIMAEAILNRAGEGRFKAYSAGSHPKESVNPNTMALLKRLNHDVAGFRSKSWEEFAAPGAPAIDFVVTVCDDAAGEACPVWPGRPIVAHWGIADPAAAAGGEAEIAIAFTEAYRLLQQRIALLVSLPIASLDRMALKAKLRAIGRNEGATAKAREET